MRGKNRAKERINRHFMPTAKRDRFRHPEAARDRRHQVVNRRILAAAVGENLHFLCAGATARFEIPRCFALAQDRLKSASFPERNLAPCSAVGMEWHDSIAVIQRLKTSVRFGTRPEAE